MSDLEGAIPAPMIIDLQMCDDNLLYNFSDAEIISVLGIADGVSSGDNMKLVDTSVSCTNLVPADFTTFPNQQHTRAEQYNTFDLVTNISTSTSTTQDVSITQDQPGVEVQGTYDAQTPIYVNLVPPQTQVNEIASDGSPTYVNLVPAQTQVNEIASDGSPTCVNLVPAQMQVNEIASDGSPTYVNLVPAQTQVNEIANDGSPTYVNLVPAQTQVNEIASEEGATYISLDPAQMHHTYIPSHDEMDMLNSDSTSVSCPAFCVSLVNQDETPITEDDGALGPPESPGNESLTTYASSSSDFSMSEEGISTLLPIPSSRCGPRTRRQKKPKECVRSSRKIEGDSSGGASQSSKRQSRSSSKKRRSRVKKTKLYERENPFTDPKAEKKRQDAINSKKNRDKKKTIMDGLRAKVDEAIKERDKLKKEVDELNKREKNLRALLWNRSCSNPLLTT